MQQKKKETLKEKTAQQVIKELKDQFTKNGFKKGIKVYHKKSIYTLEKIEHFFIELSGKNLRSPIILVSTKPPKLEFKKTSDGNPKAVISWKEKHKLLEEITQIPKIDYLEYNKEKNKYILTTYRVDGEDFLIDERNHKVNDKKNALDKIEIEL